MAKLSLVLGLVLVAMGTVAYLTADAGDRSVTALIPAFFGTPIVLLGLLAQLKPGARKHSMHGVALLALLGLIGAGMQGVPKLGALLTDRESLERPTATLVQNLMALVCLVLLLACVRAFVLARKAKSASGES
ncbi:MAG: hypothetical protein RLN60_04150 [Phycisphaerales bacterium]